MEFYQTLTTIKNHHSYYITNDGDYTSYGSLTDPKIIIVGSYNTSYSIKPGFGSFLNGLLTFYINVHGGSRTHYHLHYFGNLNGMYSIDGDRIFGRTVFTTEFDMYGSRGGIFFDQAGWNTYGAAHPDISSRLSTNNNTTKLSFIFITEF